MTLSALIVPAERKTISSFSADVADVADCTEQAVQRMRGSISMEEKKAEKTVTDRRKDTNGCERAKIDRKADETREIIDGSDGGERARTKYSRKTTGRKRKSLGQTVTILEQM